VDSRIGSSVLGSSLDRMTSPDRPQGPTRSQHDEVVWPVPVDRHGEGGLSRKRAEGPNWRRTSAGLYVPADTPVTPEQRIVEAAAALPRFGGVTGWGALRWAGGAWFDGMTAGGREPLDVQLACAHRRPQPGIAICEEGLDPDELVMVDGVPITSPVRSVCFQMRYAASVRAAVRAFDMAAYNDLVSLEEVEAYAACHSGWTGIPQCREALPFCDENSWSPPEVDMRMVWTRDAECPRPLCNVPIFGVDGRMIGTPDLFDPVAGVIGEYDGALHLAGAQRSRDLRREAAFRDLQLEYVTMLQGDAADLGPLIKRIRSAYRRAERIPRALRRWTITPPVGWTPTRTVAQRRALTEDQRSRFLAIRRQVS